MEILKNVKRKYICRKNKKKNVVRTKMKYWKMIMELIEISLHLLISFSLFVIRVGFELFSLIDLLKRVIPRVALVQVEEDLHLEGWRRSASWIAMQPGRNSSLAIKFSYCFRYSDWDLYFLVFFLFWYSFLPCARIYLFWL